nr:unnamed protein product [Digitaria exilis]
MPRPFEEISDDEWSLHNFKPSRVLKRSNPPPTQPPPPIDSFRYNPKASSSAAATSTAAVLLSSSDDDFDLGAGGRSQRAAKSQRGVKRPHRGALSRAPPSTGSFGHSRKPSALGVSDSDDDDFDITPPGTSRLSRKGKSQRALKSPQHRRYSKAPPTTTGSFRHNPKLSKATGTTGLPISEDDDSDMPDPSPPRHYSKAPPTTTGSSRHNPKRSKATGITGLSNSEDDDFDIPDPLHPASSSRTSLRQFTTSDGRLLTAAIDLSEDDDLDLPASSSRNTHLCGKGKSKKILKRPQHRQHSQAPTSIGSFRHNPKPSKAPANTGLSESEDDDFNLTDHDMDLRASSSGTLRPRRTAGRRLVTAAIDISEEDEDLDLDDDDFDYQDPRPPQQRTSGRRFVIGDDDDSDVPVPDGAVAVEEDDRVNWSELENEDEDEDFNGGRSVDLEEREGDVVGIALRKCSRISADLRQELFGSSARNIESYAEIDASACRIVTQEDVDAACTSENSGFDPVLKPYQLVGVNFLLLLHRKSIGGAILADEMGLGKTVQAVTYLTLLRHLYNDPGKAGCPAPFNVLLVGYTLFERRSAQQKDDRKALKRWQWSCVLMDEAHVLKDKGSFRWRNLMAVAQHARQRLMLTGTPLQNDLHELWSLLEFMMPDIFATGDVDLKKLLNAEDRELISRIKSILGPFILRRLKSDVKFVIMDTEQSKAYKGAIDEYRAACQARSAKSSVGMTNNVVGLIPKRQISNYFTQFRKLLISYGDVGTKGALTDEHVFASAKCQVYFFVQHLFCYVVSVFFFKKGGKIDKALAELLPSLANDGHRVLIFSQWTTMLDILEWALEVIGVTYRRLDGGLVTKDSVDENIYEIARRKLVLDAAILQSGAELDNSTDVPEQTMGEILASLLLV